MGVEHHLLRLAWTGSYERHSAVADDTAGQLERQLHAERDGARDRSLERRLCRNHRERGFHHRGAVDDAPGFDNVFPGTTANETFVGTPNSDVFVFDLGSGLDTINNFQQGADAIDLTAWGTSFVALAITKSGGNTTIDLDGVAADTDEIVLVGVTGLLASDFLF
jgi:hypothetical protein